MQNARDSVKYKLQIKEMLRSLDDPKNPVNTLEGEALRDHLRVHLGDELADLVEQVVEFEASKRAPSASLSSALREVVREQPVLWDGEYVKAFYYVHLSNGEKVPCWPNAGYMNATDNSGRMWKPEDRVMITLATDYPPEKERAAESTVMAPRRVTQFNRSNGIVPHMQMTMTSSEHMLLERRRAKRERKKR